MTPHRLLNTPVADWAVATFGTAGVTFAQSVEPSSVWSITGMSSVVAVLLWLQYKREERLSQEQTKREEASGVLVKNLMDRMGTIETEQAAKVERASDKLLQVIERQITATNRVDECLEDMSRVLLQLTEGQGRVQELLGTIVRERPCMFAQDAEMLRQPERQGDQA